MAGRTAFSLGGVNIGQSSDIVNMPSNDAVTPFEAEPPLSNAGGKIVAVVTEFPGGQKSAQLLGSFPETLSWSGKLIGGKALSRAKQLDRFRVEGQFVDLVFGSLTWFGFVKHFNIEIFNQFEISYRCEFEPLSADGNGGLGDTIQDGQSMLAQAMDIGQSQLNNPISKITFSKNIQDDYQSLQDNVNDALDANQKLASVPANTINQLQGQVTSLQQQLSSYLQSSDPAISSAASVLNSTLSILKKTLQGSNPGITQLSLQDPNLPGLAAFYYNDPSKWTLIVAANAGVLPNQPNPIGQYDIVIPADVQLASDSQEFWI